jgi:ABC-type amino acid transport system permease subunit
LKARSTIGTFLLGAVFVQLARRARQGRFVPATKLTPYMARLCEVFVDLVNTPYIVLVILLVFGVDCVQFADSTRLSEQGRVEKTGEAFESASKRGR